MGELGGRHPRAGEACGYTSKANDVTHMSDVTKECFFIYSIVVLVFLLFKEITCIFDKTYN